MKIIIFICEQYVRAVVKADVEKAEFVNLLCANSFVGVLFRFVLIRQRYKMASESESRKLTDLRVVDLRAELEKRNLDKTGVKAVLIERMQKVLKDEGVDPEVYLFETSEKRTVKRSSLSRPDTESETQSNADETIESEDEVKPDVVKQELMDDAECEVPSPPPAPIIKEGAVKVEMEPIQDDDEDGMKDVDAEELTQGDDTEKTCTEKIVMEKDTVEKIKMEKSLPEKVIAVKVNAERVAAENGLDNEDSINLTIGEDEEKLLSEEEDAANQDKGMKADGGLKTSSSSEQQDAAATEKASASPPRTSDNPGGAGKKSSPQENKSDDEGERARTTANASNSNGKTKSSVSASGNDQKAAKDDKDKKSKSSMSPNSSSNGRNLWVSGLSSSTRATDLKQVFSKFGKVIGAKVVTNARTPGARCYGYVTMATSEDASKCIQHLHRTELHGRMISVERAKGDSTGPPRKSETKSVGGGTKAKGEEKKRHERKAASSKPEKEDKEPDVPTNSVADQPELKDDMVTVVDEEDLVVVSAPPPPDISKPEDSDSRAGGSSRGGAKSRHRSVGSSHYSRPQSRSPHHNSASRGHRPVSPRRPGVLTFTQIRDERERQRQREREREQREEDRRRRDEMMRQKQIEKRQREEAARLEKELERLRVERANIARERADLIRLERQYQQMEREKLDREREELKRQQLRLLASDETRRTVKRPADDRRDPYPDDRKRVSTDRRFEMQPPRFDEASSRSGDFHSSKKEVRRGTEFPRRDGYDESRTSRRPEGVVVRREDVPEVPRVNKDARFERPPAFRVREERRTETDHRTKLDVRHTRDRYTEPTKESRYGDRRGDTWHAGGGAPPAKSFGSMTSGAPPGDTWVSSGDRKSDGAQGWGRTIDSGDRWVSGGSVPMASVRGGPSMGGPNSLYPPQGLPPSLSSINMPMSGSGVPYVSDRFDSYKSMGPMRKY